MVLASGLLSTVRYERMTITIIQPVLKDVKIGRRAVVGQSEHKVGLYGNRIPDSRLNRGRIRTCASELDSGGGL